MDPPLVSRCQSFHQEVIKGRNKSKVVFGEHLPLCKLPLPECLRHHFLRKSGMPAAIAQRGQKYIALSPSLFSNCLEEAHSFPQELF